MNYLKSITTTVLQSTGVTFPFSIGERVPGLDGQTIWDIREGVKRVGDINPVAADRLSLIHFTSPPASFQFHVTCLHTIGRSNASNPLHIRFHTSSFATRPQRSKSRICTGQECTTEAPNDTASPCVSTRSCLSIVIVLPFLQRWKADLYKRTDSNTSILWKQILMCISLRNVLDLSTKY
jgi:hypothetical protein